MGPRRLLVFGATALVAAYAFSLLLASEVWHILVANLLIGVGIGFGYAAMPMLIMRSVPQSETGASNGLNALFRSLGTSIAAAVVGAVLASLSTVQDGMQVPTASAFQLSFALGLAAAVVALIVAAFIPQRPAAESHPALPDEH